VACTQPPVQACGSTAYSCSPIVAFQLRQILSSDELDTPGVALAQLSPMSATISPGWTLNETCSTACVAWVPCPNRRERSRVSRSGAATGSQCKRTRPQYRTRGAVLTLALRAPMGNREKDGRSEGKCKEPEQEPEQ